MKLSIIIISFNTKQLTAECLLSLSKALSPELKSQSETLVVDNHSSDNSALYLKKRFPSVRVIESNQNLGFTGGNNLGIKRAHGDFCLLLNSDTIVRRGAVDQLLSFMESSDVAIASCKLLNGDGSFQANAGDPPKLWPIFFWLTSLDDLCNKLHLPSPSFHQKCSLYYQNGRQVGWVSGSVMMIRRSLFNKIGLFDERLFMYAEDVEICWRAKCAGYSIGWTDQGEIVHLGGRSSSKPQLAQWRGELRGLMYIYSKHFIWPKRLILLLLIYTFTAVRGLAYLIRGRIKFSLTYFKILFTLTGGRGGLALK